MKDLIEALTILQKYLTDKYHIQYPTYCEHDELTVCVNPKIVSDEDKVKLDELGFWPENDCFKSFKFGSC